LSTQFKSTWVILSFFQSSWPPKFVL